MKKWNKIIILGGFLFYFSVSYNAEIKEIKLLEDVSNEIIGEAGSKKTNPSFIKNKKEKKEENYTSNEIVKIEKIDPNSIIDVFEKDMKNGIAYKIDEKTPFTGLFGAVIDGQISYYESYKEGLLDGESVWYSRTGRVLLSEIYSKGKLHGEQKSYYENGNLKSIVKYLNGRVDGIIAYDKNGKILHESIFKNGTGTWKFYWSNGKLSEEGNYTSWKKDGVWKKYREDGSLDMISTYDKGRLLKERWE